MTPSYVVLGAYGGVGEALCRRLVERGARVLMAGRDAQRLAQLATDAGGETFALDATSMVVFTYGRGAYRLVEASNLEEVSGDLD